MIAAVILDIGGVACSYADDDLDRRWEARLGLAPGDLRRRLWETPLQRGAERGEVAFEDFWSAVSADLGLSPAQQRDLYEECWALTRLQPVVETWLRSLRPQYKLATLSNSWSDGRRECSTRYGLDQLVDLMVFSAEEGVAKPEPEIYMRTLARLNVNAEQAVFVDDRADNVRAAAALGLHAVRVESADALVHEVSAILAAS